MEPEWSKASSVISPACSQNRPELGEYSYWRLEGLVTEILHGVSESWMSWVLLVFSGSLQWFLNMTFPQPTCMVPNSQHLILSLCFLLCFYCTLPLTLLSSKQDLKVDICSLSYHSVPTRLSNMKLLANVMVAFNCEVNWLMNTC